MAAISISMTGAEDMIRNLERISEPRTRIKAQKSALRAGARVLRKAYKQEAPKGPTGNLKRSAMFTVKANALDGTAFAKVGSDARIAPHAHLVEFGTVTRFLKSRFHLFKDGRLFVKSPGDTTGAMPPNRFATRAFLSNADKAGEAMTKKALEEVEKAVR